MNKITLFAILLLFPLLVAAQEDNKTPSLNTQGTGKITVTPDWVTTLMSVTSKSMDYNEVINDINNKASGLEKQIVMAGFKKDDLKTASYTVNKNYVWRNGSRIDSGYIANQRFTLEFENDNKKIANLVRTLSKSKVDVNFNFNFGLSDQKKLEVESRLIEKAVEDATQKANTIANASGVKLIKIIHIAYGQKMQAPQPMFEARAMKAESSSDEFSGFNVQDLEMTDTIKMTWEVNNR